MSARWASIYRAGVRRCTAVWVRHLARMESRIALEALLDLIPEYEVDRSRVAAGGDGERVRVVQRAGLRPPLNPSRLAATPTS